MSRTSVRKLQSPLYQRLKRDRESILATRRNPFERWPQASQARFKWVGVAAREIPYDTKLAELLIQEFPPTAEALITDHTDREQAPEWILHTLPNAIAAFSIIHHTAAAEVFLPWWSEAVPFLATEHDCDGSPAAVWVKVRLGFERAQAIEQPDSLKDNRK